MDRRERAYAKSIRRADFAGARIERILVMDELRETIRFAAMKEDGTFFFAPLDVAEDELLVLIGDGIAAGVFSSRFVVDLRDMLMASAVDESSETTTADEMARAVGIDPKAFRAKLRGCSDITWHAPHDRWTVIVGSPEHNQMVQVLKMLTA